MSHFWGLFRGSARYEPGSQIRRPPMEGFRPTIPASVPASAANPGASWAPTKSASRIRAAIARSTRARKFARTFPAPEAAPAAARRDPGRTRDHAGRHCSRQCRRRSGPERGVNRQPDSRAAEEGIPEGSEAAGGRHEEIANDRKKKEAQQAAAVKEQKKKSREEQEDAETGIEKPQAPRADRQTAPRARQTMSRILLVDDSPHAQRMGERILSEEGYEVVTVSNADSALIRLDDVDPDVVLADTVMPGRTGYEICQYLKMSPRHRHVRVILTAGVLETLDEAAVAARRGRCDAAQTVRGERADRRRQTSGGAGRAGSRRSSLPVASGRAPGADRAPRRPSSQ